MPPDVRVRLRGELYQLSAAVPELSYDTAEHPILSVTQRPRNHEPEFERLG